MVIRCNYIPELGDIDIFIDEVALYRGPPFPHECELTHFGKPLGKKLILDHEDIGGPGEETRVHYLKTDPKGGWDKVYAIKVTCNREALHHLKMHGKVGSRHGDSHVNIQFDPGCKE